ncbi:TetR family transcriptional regulator [Nocardia sp. SYP-A9097]|uniref:TetR family transcriptional regulator n=1 Tax=Nocardia sp. SYP-A9097 TaxID=2663237 RepID=UPI001329DBA3|nr:TetR family transcriptional regulator [Nocardia sp. SYP-A9097]MRH86931.1 TetR family transcriptional regulator [Nocardia sp. SYP-A9097]
MAYRRTPAVQARLDAQAGSIVRAAMTVLSRDGYAGLSMAAVAAEAGVATGTVYKTFSGKAELVTAVFREVVTREVAAVAAAGDSSTGLARLGDGPAQLGNGLAWLGDGPAQLGEDLSVDSTAAAATSATATATVTDSAATGPKTARERVSAAVETFAGRALKNPKLAYVLLVEPVDTAVDTERLRFRRAFAEIYESAIADGVASGQLPPQDPRTSATALVGAIGEVLVGPLAEQLESESVVPELVAFALRALGVPQE